MCGMIVVRDIPTFECLVLIHKRVCNIYFNAILFDRKNVLLDNIVSVSLYILVPKWFLLYFRLFMSICWNEEELPTVCFPLPYYTLQHRYYFFLFISMTLQIGIPCSIQPMLLNRSILFRMRLGNNIAIYTAMASMVGKIVLPFGQLEATVFVPMRTEQKNHHFGSNILSDFSCKFI